MPRIHVLPDILIRKIAAGEVIERPASVVKELTENAVDAGATRISVAIKDGGRSLIRVTDDGCGMSPEELSLAVTPHATSKINDEDDLYRIASLGFRGEALASIGAVSRLRIISRTHESNEGGEIIVEAERVQRNRAAGCPAGCSVEVRDLFFNVPARRKFLRHAATETGHITTQFARLALSHPHLDFELTNNGRTVHKLPANTSRRERIGQLYSRELGEALIEFKRDESPLAIEGYAAPPSGSRSNTNWQFTFINGRFIRDKYVQHAIREAYRGLIDPHRSAVVFLFLSIHPSAVDVNVHPTKIEVRWADSNVVHSQVLSALREALQSADLTPPLSTERGRLTWPLQSDPVSSSSAQNTVEDAGLPPTDGARQDQVRREFAQEMQRSVATQPPPALSPDRPASSSAPPRTPESSQPARLGEGAEVWRAMYGQANESLSPPVSHQDAEGAQPTFGSLPGAFQLHNTYLVCETDDGMMIIDQHALHERILYNQLKERHALGKLESQRLLLPETVQVTSAQMALLETHASLLDQLGLEVTPFGKDSAAIQSFPALLKDTDAVSFLQDLLDKLEQKGGPPHTELIIHELLNMMACKAAVKAGDPLTRQEIDALVSQREVAEKSSNCPHGRPTTLLLTVKDLERQFKRT